MTSGQYRLKRSSVHLNRTHLDSLLITLVLVHYIFSTKLSKCKKRVFLVFVILMLKNLRAILIGFTDKFKCTDRGKIS